MLVRQRWETAAFYVVSCMLRLVIRVPSRTLCCAAQGVARLKQSISIRCLGSEVLFRLTVFPEKGAEWVIGLRRTHRKKKALDLPSESGKHSPVCVRFSRETKRVVLLNQTPGA
jgi:hypothetical protein